MERDAGNAGEHPSVRTRRVPLEYPWGTWSVPMCATQRTREPRELQRGSAEVGMDGPKWESAQVGRSSSLHGRQVGIGLSGSGAKWEWA